MTDSFDTCGGGTGAEEVRACSRFFFVAPASGWRVPPRYPKRRRDASETVVAPAGVLPRQRQGQARPAHRGGADFIRTGKGWPWRVTWTMGSAPRPPSRYLYRARV